MSNSKRKSISQISEAYDLSPVNLKQLAEIFTDILPDGVDPDVAAQAFRLWELAKVGQTVIVDSIVTSDYNDVKNRIRDEARLTKEIFIISVRTQDKLFMLSVADFPDGCEEGWEVSHGSLRPQDIWDNILHRVLIRTPAYNHYFGWAASISTDGNMEDVDPGDWSNLFETVMSYLNDIAPMGWCFEVHPSDGSSFGFWPLQDEDG